jgi:hypothetical protein
MSNSTSEIKKWIEEIRFLAENERDYEAAHSSEDELYSTFIRRVAFCRQLTPKLREEAKLILSTQKLSFPRDCA